MLPLFVTGVASEQASAALVIEVDSTEIGAGQSGVVNVWISSSDGTDSLSFFNVVFSLTPVGNAISRLDFTDPQTALGGTDSSYVFAEDRVPNGLLVETLQRDLVQGGDLTASRENVSLPQGPMRKLLTRLDVRHELLTGQSASQAIGEQFQLSLLGEITVFEDTLETIFEDASGRLNLDFSNVSSGTISIVAPSVTAVPEPSSMILLAAGGAGWLVRSRRKRSALAAASNAR